MSFLPNTSKSYFCGLIEFQKLLNKNQLKHNLTSLPTFKIKSLVLPSLCVQRFTSHLFVRFFLHYYLLISSPRKHFQTSPIPHKIEKYKRFCNSVIE